MTHTALRKCCDSNASSLMWNLIYLLDKPWQAWMENAWQMMLEQTPKTKKQVAKIFREALEQVDWGKSENAALKCAGQFMQEEDWLGMVDYFEEER